MKASVRNITHPVTVVLSATVLVFAFTRLAEVFGFSPLMIAGAQALAIGMVLAICPLDMEFASEPEGKDGAPAPSASVPPAGTAAALTVGSASALPAGPASDVAAGQASAAAVKPAGAFVTAGPASDVATGQARAVTAESARDTDRANRFPTSIIALVFAAASVVALLGLGAMLATSYFGWEYVSLTPLFGERPGFGVFTRLYTPDIAGIASGALAINLVTGIFTCLLVAVWEEGFFRGILISCMLKGVPLRNPRRFAAIATAIVFGLLHITFAANESMMLQGVLKGVQAGLFGYCLAVYFISTGSLGECIVIHSVFDLVYFAPTILSTGTLSEAWAWGTPFAGVQLIASIVILAVAAGMSRRQLR